MRRAGYLPDSGVVVAKSGRMLPPRTLAMQLRQNPPTVMRSMFWTRSLRSRRCSHKAPKAPAAMCSMMGSVGASSFSTTMDMEEKAKGDERFLDTGWTGGGSADEGTMPQIEAK